MEDTPRSQTISTQSQEIAQQVARPTAGKAGTSPLLVRESSLLQLRVMAEADPELVFNSVAHRIDVFLLRQSFRQLRKSDSSGVDEVTAKQYKERLMDNLHDLDQVAYVRFASVYRNFRETKDFEEFIGELGDEN